jgi:molybdenum cofactor synthesis domain-containing protein
MTSSRRTAAVVTIGNEIVEGRIANENCMWLSQQLIAQGYWPRINITVPDEEALIVDLLTMAARSSDVVLVSGGLGFTPDDITRNAVARAFNCELEVHEAVAAEMSTLCAWATPDLARKVATFPTGATPIYSPCGGTPGFRINNVVVLPGVPTEMRSMFAVLDLPVTGTIISSRTLTFETTEDQILEVLHAFEMQHPDVRLGSYPSFHATMPQVEIVVTSHSAPALDAGVAWLAAQMLPKIATA